MDRCREIAEKVLSVEGYDQTASLYFCPLLKREITEEYCCTVNMIEVMGCVNYVAVDKDPTLGRKKKPNFAERDCLKCEHFYWSGESIEGMLSGRPTVKALMEFVMGVKKDKTDQNERLSDEELRRINEYVQENCPEFGVAKNLEPFA